MKDVLAIVLRVGSCHWDETVSFGVCEPESDEERIERMVESIQPLLVFFRARSSGKEGMEMLSYEIVRDRKTGAMAVLNFKTELFFPVASREEYVRIATDTFILDQAGNRSRAGVSAAKAIASGLETGWCSATYKKGRPIVSIVHADQRFFGVRGLASEYTRISEWFQIADLEEGKARGSLASVKLYTLIL